MNVKKNNLDILASFFCLKPYTSVLLNLKNNRLRINIGINCKEKYKLDDNENKPLISVEGRNLTTHITGKNLIDHYQKSFEDIKNAVMKFHESKLDKKALHKRLFEILASSYNMNLVSKFKNLESILKNNEVNENQKSLSDRYCNLFTQTKDKKTYRLLPKDVNKKELDDVIGDMWQFYSKYKDQDLKSVDNEKHTLNMFPTNELFANFISMMVKQEESENLPIIKIIKNSVVHVEMESLLEEQKLLKEKFSIRDYKLGLSTNAVKNTSCCYGCTQQIKFLQSEENIDSSIEPFYHSYGDALYFINPHSYNSNIIDYKIIALKKNLDSHNKRIKHATNDSKKEELSRQIQNKIKPKLEKAQKCLVKITYGSKESRKYLVAQIHDKQNCIEALIKEAKKQIMTKKVFYPKFIDKLKDEIKQRNTLKKQLNEPANLEALVLRYNLEKQKPKKPKNKSIPTGHVKTKAKGNGRC